MQRLLRDSLGIAAVVVEDEYPEHSTLRVYSELEGAQFDKLEVLIKAAGWQLAYRKDRHNRWVLEIE